jgi:hypothetical protein
MIQDKKIIQLPNLHMSMFHREEFSFKLVGVHPAVRRIFYEAITVCIPVKVLVPKFNEDTFETDNPYVMINYLIKQISAIPLSQDIPLDAKFHINIKNNDSKFLIVTSSEIRCLNYDEIYFDNNYKLFTLNPVEVRLNWS